MPLSSLTFTEIALLVLAAHSATLLMQSDTIFNGPREWLLRLTGAWIYELDENGEPQGLPRWFRNKVVDTTYEEDGDRKSGLVLEEMPWLGNFLSRLLGCYRCSSVWQSYLVSTVGLVAFDHLGWFNSGFGLWVLLGLAVSGALDYLNKLV